MNRQYIHLASSKTLLKKGSQVIITLNVKKYLEEGIKLFRLADGNIAVCRNRSDKKAKGEDVCILTHSNKICIVTLAENHPILSEKKSVISVDYQFDNVNRLCNRVSGKGKKGAQHLSAESSLCRVTCEDKTQYFVPCGLKCQLLETNDNLKSQPKILTEKPLTDGFIAIVMPKLKDYAGEMAKLLTKEEYMKTNDDDVT